MTLFSDEVVSNAHYLVYKYCGYSVILPKKIVNDYGCIKASVYYLDGWLLLKDATPTFMKAVVSIL